MRVSIIASAFFLGACAHNPQGIEVRTVEVPVPAPCVPIDQIPEEPPLIADQLTGEPDHDIGIIAGSALLLRDWGRRMEAALKACAGE